MHGIKTARLRFVRGGTRPVARRRFPRLPVRAARKRSARTIAAAYRRFASRKARIASATCWKLCSPRTRP
jgi:hypothetical protein